MSPAHPFIRLMARAERDACASADTVVSILPAADRHLITRGMPPERYVHVPDGISIAEADAGEPLLSEQAGLVRSLRSEGRSSSATPAGSASSMRSTIFSWPRRSCATRRSRS